MLGGRFGHRGMVKQATFKVLPADGPIDSEEVLDMKMINNNKDDETTHEL